MSISWYQCPIANYPQLDNDNNKEEFKLHIINQINNLRLVTEHYNETTINLNSFLQKYTSMINDIRHMYILKEDVNIDDIIMASTFGQTLEDVNNVCNYIKGNFEDIIQHLGNDNLLVIITDTIVLYIELIDSNLDNPFKINFYYFQ